MSNKQQIYREVKEKMGLVPQWIKEIPEGALGGFWETAKNFWLAETVLPNKYKELIGVAVSGVTRCRYCALFHTESAKLFGATSEEIAEASFMGGLSMLGSSFINAQQIDYEQFRKETLEIVAYVKKHT